MDRNTVESIIGLAGLTIVTWNEYIECDDEGCDYTLIMAYVRSEVDIAEMIINTNTRKVTLQHISSNRIIKPCDISDWFTSDDWGDDLLEHDYLDDGEYV